jgi:hypothetical protein
VPCVWYEILNSYLVDTLSARELLSNGRYRRVASCRGRVSHESAANPRCWT